MTYLAIILLSEMVAHTLKWNKNCTNYYVEARTSELTNTTAAVCISRRVLKGKKYRFRDIHNFSFSVKIQDGRQKWRKLELF